MLMVGDAFNKLTTEQLVGIHNLLVDHTKTGEKMESNDSLDREKLIASLGKWLDQTDLFVALDNDEKYVLVPQAQTRMDPVVAAKVTRAPNASKKVDKQETVREALKLVSEDDLLKIVKLSKVPIEKLREYLNGTTIGFQDVLDIDKALQALSQGEDKDQSSTSTSEDSKKMPATATAKAATKSTKPPAAPASKKTPGGGRRLKVVSPQVKKSTARSTEKKVPFTDDQKITVKFKTNPKREGSKVFKIYEIFKSSATVGDFRKEAISQKLVEDGHGTLKAAVKEKAISIK